MFDFHATSSNGGKLHMTGLAENKQGFTNWVTKLIFFLTPSQSQSCAVSRHLRENQNLKAGAA